MATPNGLNPTFDSVNLINGLYIGGTQVIDSSGNISAGSTVTLGDAISDTTIVKGRIATGSLAGSALNITSAYLYGEGQELRYSVSDWTGRTSFTGMYLRSEGALGGSYDINGAQIYGVMNTSTTTGLSNLKALYTEMLVKASSSNRTLTNGTSLEANISIENQTGTLTLTNNVYCFHAKAQTGTGLADYTKINGIKISGRDDGTARVFGTALDISDPEATVCSWTTGISISTATAKGISITGACSSNPLYIHHASGQTTPSIKVHNHLNTSEIGGGEFKGEFLNTTGTVDGIASHWGYSPTGATGAPSSVRASISNMTLSAGNTMTAGWLVGSQSSTIVSGTLNGATICEFGALGVLDGDGTRTLVAHSAGLASVLHVAAGDEPATGELSMLYMTSDYGGTVDNAIYIDNHALVTNFLNLTDAGNTGFVTTGGTDCTASGATDPSFTIKCIMPGGAAGYIRVWAAA